MGWLEVIGLIAPSVISMFSGDQGQSEAAASQGALNAELLKMFRKREDVELPFRENLLKSLSQRNQKQFPTFKMPVTPPTFNPWGNMRTSMPLGVAPTVAGGARGAQTEREMMSFLTTMQNGNGGV
jgi:hypothetical protein